ncbi:hypothetical protein [Parachlamydia sp. AcF125]|uniref:hypothetical protein n=1 Tax=Parachlamydia sp. AcF125 TaxID=2795736 RepID=UPI001BCA3A6B|nr:hypothetical protein [Parachlamydia sp. AcF125]MBS4169292.1 hypothetical protein [Parachlamydia sp. AcF125]
MGNNEIRYGVDPSIKYGFWTRYRAAYTIKKSLFSSLAIAWKTRNKTSEAVREFFIEKLHEHPFSVKDNLSRYNWKKHWPDFVSKLLLAITNKVDTSPNPYNPKVSRADHELMQEYFQTFRATIHQKLSYNKKENCFVLDKRLLTKEDKQQILIVRGYHKVLKEKEEKKRLRQNLLNSPMVKEMLKERVRLVEILGGKEQKISYKKSSFSNFLF